MLVPLTKVILGTRVLVEALKATTAGPAAVGKIPCIPMCASNGTMAPALTVVVASGGIVVGPAMKPEKWENNIRPHRMDLPMLEVGRTSRVFSPSVTPSLSSFGGEANWTSDEYIKAHLAVVSSGKHNFEGCRIPIPTTIRYDRLRLALGEAASPKQARVLDLLEFGMPIDCSSHFGVTKKQKNHHSAVGFKKDIDEYLYKNMQVKAILGPFEYPPIPDLCYSPLMTVPKEETKRRVIVDFSFPPGKAINDGISKLTYLDHIVEFSLPSVQSMVSRLNALGIGCLMYKKDLKSAFRQFCTDPGDYKFTGLSWEGMTYLDTRLAMGLRSSAYCCQSVTELVAYIVSKKAHVLVYLDDFGGAELAGKAEDSFQHLGELLGYFGLEEAQDKAVAPTTRMEWLGISFDTVEWTMALKPGKLQELLAWLPKLLKLKRVKKVLLQKVLGSLVWASAVVRAGVIFFNRLLALLRKLKRPNHSIYFSKEAKKDVQWWLLSLQHFEGKCPIPPSVWTPLTNFSTDASLDGFGMVWGTRALAGIFALEFDELDISKKEMLAVMAAIKHWFVDLASLKVKIFVDNQACVALLNYGITKSPFLASCLREISFFLAKYNIEIRAEYIPSKENKLADLCSRAFSSDTHYSNFNQLLKDGTLVLEEVFYDKFNFDHVFN